MRRAVLTAACLVGLAAGGVQAQQSVGVATRNGSASITVPTVLFVDASNLNVSFPTPDHAAFEAQRIVSSTQSAITHAANVQHSVQIRANDDYMTAASTGALSAKPSSDLQWSLDGATFTPLDAAGRDVVTGARPGMHRDEATLQYQMLLDYATDQPDTYSLGFTLTIIAN